ncbi:M20 family metallopeptidase [Halocynthiibacter sp. C4]|uniref:M20 aminoacylase family protein n=1 Tax=Halocynthiibacter sp. C4 TaxID=2992758 RepID=UPI00237C165A|nr:M20 aminoacylase family protein [Halocynthiibacter sp. C4]MDE0589346.1 M20 family metallopeptidase [Halocynthiibacter sp. C4]
MAIINRIGDFTAEMTEWRHWMHQHPELGFECHETAAFVAEKLRAFGVDELHEGIAESGLVAIINGQGEGPTIGLRADMDALPITEETGADYASLVEGKMHACGHDGHTSMLLGAAKYLAETRNFTGRVALIFQPAEEGGGGARVMCEEGIIERFDISSVYALHNATELPLGMFATTPGPMMAAVDDFDIHVRGSGGHGAAPQMTKDPLIAAVGLVQAIQTIVSRNHATTDDLVVSVTQIHSGSADNIIPDTAYINGTVRSFDKGVQAMVISRLEALCKGHALAYDVDIELKYNKGYPPTINHPAETEKAVQVAQEIAGEDSVDGDTLRGMWSEDFAYMLEKCPGAYLNLGQDTPISVHHPAYDFNDEILPIGASFFARLVERLEPAK